MQTGVLVGSGVEVTLGGGGGMVGVDEGFTTGVFVGVLVGTAVLVGVGVLATTLMRTEVNADALLCSWR